MSSAVQQAPRSSEQLLADAATPPPSPADTATRLALYEEEIDPATAEAYGWLTACLEGRVSVGRAALMLAVNRGVSVDRAHLILHEVAARSTGSPAVHRLAVLTALQRNAEVYEQLQNDESIDLVQRLSAARMLGNTLDRIMRVTGAARAQLSNEDNAQLEADDTADRLDQLMSVILDRTAPPASADVIEV